jgi:hypothetical protein
VRAKYAWSLFLFLLAAPIASADPVTGFGPFTARAHGTVLMPFMLETSSGILTGFHSVSVNIAVHRNAPGGNVSDDTQGSIVLHDLDSGTMISRISIGVAVLTNVGGLQGLDMTGPAKVNDPVLDDGDAASYGVTLIDDPLSGAGSFFISVISPNFNLSYGPVTLDTVEVTPG